MGASRPRSPGIPSRTPPRATGIPRGGLVTLPGSPFSPRKKGIDTTTLTGGRRRGRRSPDPRAINTRTPLTGSVPRKGPDIGVGGGPVGTVPRFPRGRGRGRMRSCPDPNMLILMSDDTQKKAGDLVVGDLVKTYHEESFDLGNYEVEYVNIVENVEKIKLNFDQIEIICSLTHKFYVDNSWKEAKDMVIGDVVSDKKLTAKEKVQDGDVVHITVKDAHTYICEGLLSHNKRFIRPPKEPRTPDPKAINTRSPLTGGYNPKSGVRYTADGTPTAVEQTERVPVQDPTLGGPPEREVPIPKETRQPITRESDPRGRAPFSPDERGMARDRFFERMFDRAEERRQQRSMEKAERDNVGDALRSERELRESEIAGPGDERQGGGRGRRRRGGGRRRGRRRDFTRRRSRMEGGRRGRSGREMAEFRDRYVSTLR